MRKTIGWLCLGLLGASPLVGCKRAPACDVSSNDAVRALYHKLTNEELDTKHECIERSAVFPGLVRVGHFAYDRGCRDRNVIVNCQLDPPDVARQALASAGWAQADLAQRQQLALSWLTEGEDDVVLRAQPSQWPTGKAFAPPQSSATDDGGLLLRYWRGTHHGKTRMTSFTSVEVRFQKDGSHSPAQEGESVEVELRSN